MHLKDFFVKKYIIFYLAVLTFVFFLVATLVIGFETKESEVVITLNTIAEQIQDFNHSGIAVPQILVTTFGLLVSGLIFSGISLILLAVTLFEFPKLGKYEDIIWWFGIAFVLLAMILLLAGEGYYANEVTKSEKPLKFEDIFNVGRFAGLMICLTTLPLTTFITAAVWYPSMNKSPEIGQ